MKKYKIFDHTADLGIEIVGDTPAHLFENAVLAMADLTADTSRVKAMQTKVIKASGTDWDDLWVNFLREILYTINGERFLIKDGRIRQIDDALVTVELRGESFDPDRHRIKTEIKAVTYHQAAIKNVEHGWQGRVILDV